MDELTVVQVIAGLVVAAALGRTLWLIGDDALDHIRRRLRKRGTRRG